MGGPSTRRCPIHQQVSSACERTLATSRWVSAGRCLGAGSIRRIPHVRRRVSSSNLCRLVNRCIAGGPAESRRRRHLHSGRRDKFALGRRCSARSCIAAYDLSRTGCGASNCLSRASSSPRAWSQGRGRLLMAVPRDQGVVATGLGSEAIGQAFYRSDSGAFSVRASWLAKRSSVAHSG